MRRVVATVLSAVLVVLCAALPATGTGSAGLFPEPSPAACETSRKCRPAIEWRTGHYGPSWGNGIPRRTMLSLYAVAGEQILLGSSSLPSTGAGASDVVVWAPGVVPDPQTQHLPAPQFSCVAQRATAGNGTRGFIANRAEEVAGPESVDGTGNTAGYRPCYYTAPSTGIYRVAFYGSDGASSNSETSPTGDVAPSGAFGVQRTAVNAWDVTVRPAASSSTDDRSGRLFTYVFAGYTGDNPRPVHMTMYLTTHDGFLYRVDTNGFDPNGFVFYGNREGFLDSDGTPLNRDVVPTTRAQSPQTLSELLGGVSIAPPEYPLSFEPLAPETLAVLAVPQAPAEPVVSAISYTGQVTRSGSYVGRGGTFTFTAGTPGTYEIVLSRDGADFDPGLAANRVLRGVVERPGTYDVAWDGLDNDRDDFPVGNDFEYAVTLRGGEYHAPMIDVESSVEGGPSITLVNPPGGRCPFSGIVSDGTNCTRAFYDDRAYVAANGTQVGDPVTGQLCTVLVKDANLPLTTFADPTTGFDSAGTDRAFGTTGKTNVNKACVTSDPSTLGDARGLDLWTYFPSSRLSDTLDVLPIPAAPVAVDDDYSTDVSTTLTVPVATGVLADDTGASPTVAVRTDPSSGVLSLAADGSLVYEPATGFSGVVTFDYTLTDDAGQTDTATVTVTVRPTGEDDEFSTATGTPVTVPAAAGLLANDRGSLAVDSVTQPEHGAVALVGTAGSFTYTPPAGWSGSTTFTYVATDGVSEVEQTVTVTVTPSGEADGFTTSVGTTLELDAGAGVLANDTGALTVGSHTQPEHGRVDVAADGSLTYVPPAGWSGSTTFEYTAGDGTTDITHVVTLTVTPTAAADSATTSAGTVLEVPAGTGLLANDAGSLLVTAATDPTHGDVEVGSTGAYVYTPHPGFSGTDTFTYTASDGVSTPLTRTVTILVTPLGADDTATTTVDTSLLVPAVDGLLANDTGTLRATHVTVPDHGIVFVDADGGYLYTPPTGWSGTDTFGYTASDGVSDVHQEVVVTVVPTAVDDTGAVAVDGTLTVPPASGLLANDRGALQVVATSAPAHGTVSATPDGGWTYTPSPGWSGADTFTYDATDGTTTLRRTVTVTVTPTAADDAATLPGGGTATFPVEQGLLANDAGDLTVASWTQPEHGRVTVSPDGAYVYDPPAGWSGRTTFTYTAVDGAGHEVTRVATLTVVPDAAPDAYTARTGEQLTVPADQGVLDNDTGTLTVTGHTQPEHGVVDVRPDGSFTFTPAVGRHGTVTFTYTASDGVNPPVTRTVTVTVEPAAPAATPGDDTVPGHPGEPTVLRPLDNDPVGDGVTWIPGSLVLVDPATGTPSRVVDVPGVGRWEVLEDDTVRFTPADGFSGTAVVEYRVTDDAGRTLSARMTVRHDGQPGLADTGAPVGAVAVLAALLVAAGAVLVGVRRRTGSR